MNRLRPTYVRQDSNSSTGTPTGSMSPSMHRHARSGSGSGTVGVNRSQQTKAAAVRLARVMAHQPGDSDDDEDDLDLYNPAAASPGLGLAGSRPAARSRSPLMSVRRNSTDQAGPVRSGSGLRSSHSADSVEQEQTSSRYSLTGRSSNASSAGKISPARSSLVNRPSQSTTTEEPEVSPFARSSLINRPSKSTTTAEPVASPFARSSLINRPSQSTNTEEPVVSPIARSSLINRPSQSTPTEEPEVSPFARSSLINRPSKSTTTAEPVPSPFARSSLINRPSQSTPTEEPVVSPIARSSLINRPSQSTPTEEPEVSPFARSSLINRPSKSTTTAEPVASPFVRSSLLNRPSKSTTTAEPVVSSFARTSLINRPSQSTTNAEPLVSPYARSSASPTGKKTLPAYSVPGNRSFRSTNTEEEEDEEEEDLDMEPVQISRRMPSLRSFKSNSTDQQTSASSIALGRPSVGLKPVRMLPSAVPVTLKAATSETQPDTQTEKKLLDFGTSKLKDTGTQPTPSSASQDELAILKEQNESLLEKLRLAEERREEAEVMTRQLEQQIANLGDSVSQEANLLNRKEAALQQREAALKAATRNSGGQAGEVAIAVLRTEAETAREEAATATAQLSDVIAEFKSLQQMTQRMILTQEEMEEVVLKRCWLARYWSLCVRHGIHAEIASARYEYWSAYAPLPNEVVLAAAERAKEERGVSNDAEERESKLQKKEEFSGEGNVENMLLVDKGLKELTCLKVEEALVIAMAQKRRAASATSAQTDELKLPIEGKNYSEGFELTEEEQEDVTFKQAWLAYFWRRVKTHGLEPDIADERLEYWIDRMSKLPISNDAVDVERGLMELKKLAIEIKLWEISRLSVDPDSSKKTLLDHDS